MPLIIKSGERRRRRRQPLNFSAARGQPVILIKSDQDACGGDRRKPDRGAHPEGGEENRQKDDCAKNSGHTGVGDGEIKRRRDRNNFSFCPSVSPSLYLSVSHSPLLIPIITRR